MHVHANSSSSAHGWDKSPAQQARNTYNIEPGPGFGRIVSEIARGIYDPTSSTDPAANNDGSAGGADTTTTGPTDGTDGTPSTTSQDGSTDPTQSQMPGTVDMSV